MREKQEVKDMGEYCRDICSQEQGRGWEASEIMTKRLDKLQDTWKTKYYSVCFFF
jgi:hypothetical protein